jgi:UDP-galactose transporter B1
MARTKQATPLRREPSSEYFSKNDGSGTPSRSPRNLDKEKEGSNGFANGSVVKKSEGQPEKKEAGALQLVFAVTGIYGSL